MKDIRLIATDLDGTLVGIDDERPLYDGFRQLIDDFRRDHHAVWAICTGRSLKSFRRVFLIMEHCGIMPDFVIVKHAYIYHMVGHRCVPHIMWNVRIRQHIWRHRQNIRRTLGEWRALILSRFENVTVAIDESNRLCLRFADADDATHAAKVLREKAQGHILLNVFEYHGEIDVRVVPLTKGMALSELAEGLKVSRENVLAIGDGHNDIGMMDRTVAGHVGCPANAKEEVVELVHQSGGHVARGRFLEGVIEVLRAFDSDTVSSALPEGWQSLTSGSNPYPHRQQQASRFKSRQSHYRKRQQIKAFWMIGAGLYMTALVFAHFHLIPHSGLIMLPYKLVLKVIGKIVAIATSSH